MTITPSQSLSDESLRANGDPRVIGGRYQLLRQLKKGPDATAFLASDLSAGGNVVIKTVAAASLSASARMRLEHDANVLSQVKNGQFAPVLGFGSEDDQVYLVMPFIPGLTLQERLEQGPLSVIEAITLGQALLAALSAAHAHAVLHRDVKPANVIVNEGVPLREATLIDFGLARSTRLDASIRDQWVGTAQYLSPEGAGLLDEQVTACSDLYSAGIVLFECLAGRPPFHGESVGEVLRKHMTLPPPELRSLGLKVPRVFDEVIQRLLRKDPRDRYQSAAAVVADLRVIAEALERGESEPDLVVGLYDRRHTLTEPAFVGRDQELAALNTQLERTQAGQGGLVLLEAESGGGKSRLLSEFAQRGAQQGAWILRGQGLDQAAQRPFQLLTGVAEGLVATANLEPDVVDSIRTGLGDYHEAACSALPQLATLFASDGKRQLGPEEHVETRSVQALTALLDALGATGRSVLVLLDDCQWADQLTLRVLSNWQRRTENTRRPVLVVGSFRSEEVSSSHPLRALNFVAHLTLPTFQAANVRKLVESMAGALPDEAVEVIERLAEGNPFMAAAALRGLVESDALVPISDADRAEGDEETGGWRVDPLALADVQSSRHAAAFLVRRIELLPDSTLKLLSVGAVLGKEFDLFTASKLVGQTSAQSIAALHEAQQRHIIWAKASDDQCAFIHAKLRQTLLDRLPENERRELHLHAAIDLEAEAPDRAYELAYHFDAAGECQRALPYALAAAIGARTQHALELAEQNYRIAERGERDADEATRYRIAEGLGDVLMLRGHYQAAAQLLEAANFLAKDDMTRAQIEGRLAELAFKQGDIQPAIEANERALGLLGRKVPQSTAILYAQLLREALVQLLHTLLPKWFLARKPLKGVEKELLAVRLDNRLSYAYWFGRGKVPCLWAHLRGMNRAELYPPTLELAQAYSIQAPVMSLLRLFNRGISYSQRSHAVYKSLGDLWGQGQAIHFNGLVLYVAARYDECVEKCREAIRLLERTGDVWEVNIARYHIAASLYRLGDLAGAVAEANHIHQSGLDVGDIQASGVSLDVLVRAAGRVSAEELQTELDRERFDVQGTAQVMLAQGVRLLMLERAQEAADVLESALDAVARKDVQNSWTYPLRSWLASALRIQAEKLSSLAPDRQSALLRRAKKISKKAVKIARTFQTDLPHALREAGLIAAMQGSIRKARRYLDESLAVAERQGARFEHAQTLLARGRVGLEVGWPGADEDAATARQALRALGADFALDDVQASEPEPAETATLSLVDRFDTVLDAGRRIASQLSRATIFKEVREAAQRLLRGERCLLHRLEDDDDAEELTAISGELDAEYVRAIAERALASGQVIVFAEGEDDDEEALLAGIRSALCAPVFVRGKPAGCFYVDHRNVSGLFGEDEQRLAEFIATIAGAALENAQGFAKLQQLAATLDQKVRKRTKDIESQKLELEALNKELGRSNEELEQFAYVASHDLQEPLRTIASYCQILQRRYVQDLDEKANEFIDFAIDGATRMKKLISDLLTYSRVGTRGKEFTATSMDKVVRRVIASLRIQIEDQGAVVTHDPLPVVMADETQMSQLLQNLIGNGMKFCGEKSPHVHVSCSEGENGSLTFSVKDNGIGIESEHFDRIFQIFQRLHTRTEYQGTGIGLAVCKKTVERHGGDIWVDSKPGEGCTFYFTIPKCDSTEDGSPGHP